MRNHLSRLLLGVLMVGGLVLIACEDDAGDAGDGLDDGSPTVTGTVGGGSAGAVDTPTNTATAGASSPTAEASDEEAAGEVEDSIESMIAAQSEGDLDEFLTYWTDNGLQAEFDSTREEIQQAGAEEFQAEGAEVREFSNTTVTGETATTDAEMVFGPALDLTRFTLVREDDTWKIDDTERLSPEIPSGVTTIDVTMQEFAFNFDASQIEAGELAFAAENIGGQPHELVLVKIPEDLDLQQALQSEEEPEGIEFYGYTSAEPGEQKNMVFTEELGGGRYAMVCFLPDTADPEQPPHALKGMVAEFTIE